jgi:hypothetical protein
MLELLLGKVQWLSLDDVCKFEKLCEFCCGLAWRKTIQHQWQKVEVIEGRIHTLAAS